MLSLCGNLTEISIYPQSEGREIPFELIVTPTQFSTQLVPDRFKWWKLTSFFFNLPSNGEWRHLILILPRMPNLTTLYLLVDAEVPEDDNFDAQAELALGEEADLALDDFLSGAVTHINNLNLRIDNSKSLLFLRRVMRFWKSISKLSVSIPYGEMLMDDVDFHDFLEMTPPSGDLEELMLYVPPLSLLDIGHLPDVSILDRLSHLKTLVLPSVQFGPLSFEALVHSCPLIQVFKIGDSSDCLLENSFGEQDDYKHVSGLGLMDLATLSAWKYLKECILFVDVDDHAVESLPAIDVHPPGLFREFAETFVRLKDADFLPRLQEELKSECRRLERIEVIASVYDFSEARHSFRPLVFASRCGLGRLHFT